MEFHLPSLPFKKDALTPFMSEETLEYHHGMHHKAYVEKLNKLLAEQGQAYRSLEEIVCSTEGKLFNNAAQTWNHTFFWHCLSQSARHNNISEELKIKIDASFGSLESLQEKFNQVAMDVFGTGWCWLVKDKQHGQLKIIGTDDAKNPMTQGFIPLLVCDMWEHAYYIDFRNSREKYLEAFWKIINWEFVSDRFHDNEFVNLTDEMLNKPESSTTV